MWYVVKLNFIGSIVTSPCGCDECAKQLGEKCGGIYRFDGTCDTAKLLYCYKGYGGGYFINYSGICTRGNLFLINT